MATDAANASNAAAFLAADSGPPLLQPDSCRLVVACCVVGIAGIVLLVAIAVGFDGNPCGRTLETESAATSPFAHQRLVEFAMGAP